MPYNSWTPKSQVFGFMRFFELFLCLPIPGFSRTPPRGPRGGALTTVMELLFLARVIIAWFPIRWGPPSANGCGSPSPAMDFSLISTTHLHSRKSKNNNNTNNRRINRIKFPSSEIIYESFFLYPGKSKKLKSRDRGSSRLETPSLSWVRHGVA